MHVHAWNDFLSWVGRGDGVKVVSKEFLGMIRIVFHIQDRQWGAAADLIRSLRAESGRDCAHLCLLEGLVHQRRFLASLVNKEESDPELLVSALRCFLRGLELCRNERQFVKSVFPFLQTMQMPTDRSNSSDNGGPTQPSQHGQPGLQQPSCPCDSQYDQFLRWPYQRRINGRYGPILYPFASPVSPMLQTSLPFPSTYGFTLAHEMNFRLSHRGVDINWIDLELAKCYSELLQLVKRLDLQLEFVRPSQGGAGSEGRHDTLRSWLSFDISTSPPSLIRSSVIQ